MTRARQEDLRKTSISDYFNRLSTSLKSLSSFIDSFNGSSINTLKGNGFDAVRARMSYYIDAIEKTSRICNIFSNNVTAANNQLIVFMDDLSEIDNSLLEEEKGLLSKAEADLFRLESFYSYTYINQATGKTETSWARVGSASEISECKSHIAYLKHIIDKMEKLDGEDRSAFSTLEAVNMDINNLDSAVSNIHVMNYNPNFLETIDTSNLKDKEIALMEIVSKNWPSDLSEDRKKIVEIALSYLNKGHIYDQKHRGQPTNYKNPEGSLFLDCSYFVSKVLSEFETETRKKKTIEKSFYTGRYVGHTETSPFMEVKSIDELLPGDVALLNTSTEGEYGNHVVLYIGRDDNNKPVYMECIATETFSGIRFTQRKDLAVFRRLKTIEN